MKKVDITKVRLEYVGNATIGSGKQIKAMIGQKVPCVEFTMRGDVAQPITWTPDRPVDICSDPWIQFQPKEWSEMIHDIFTEMVRLWNEKHGK